MGQRLKLLVLNRSNVALVVEEKSSRVEDCESEQSEQQLSVRQHEQRGMPHIRAVCTVDCQCDAIEHHATRKLIADRSRQTDFIFADSRSLVCVCTSLISSACKRGNKHTRQSYASLPYADAKRASLSLHLCLVL